MIWYHGPYSFNGRPLWTIGSDGNPQHGIVQIITFFGKTKDFSLKIWGPHSTVKGFIKKDNWIQVIS